MTLSEAEQPVEEQERLPYEKPVLRSMGLFADQVLGVGCKSDGGTPAATNVVGCLTTPCLGSGS
jgi:hypothetical protein